MMSLGLETNTVVGVPAPEGTERPNPHERFWFRELSEDRIEVHHPFHGTLTLGNRTDFPDPAVDTALVLGLRTLAYTTDCMKLSRNRRFETQPGAGEYANVSHGVSLAAIARLSGGGPQDILSAFFSDMTHTKAGHGDEDNFQRHGTENLHDIVSQRFFHRAGLIDSFIEHGVLVGDELMLRGTRLVGHQFLSEAVAKVRRSFLSNDHKARRMDSDRFQYNEEEDYYAKRKSATDTQRALSTMARMTIPEDDEGEQLVFTDEEAALSSGISYTRKNIEHWLEPVQDALSDLMNFIDRYFFVCDHPIAQAFQEHHPHDYLHTSYSRMIGIYDVIAEDDPVMAYLLNTAESIAAHQRTVMPTYTASNPYGGPVPPEGMTLQKISNESQAASIRFEDGHLHFVLPPGKVRTIDPRILRPNGETIPVSVRYPEFAAFLESQMKFIGTHYATLEVPTDMRREIDEVVRLVDGRWPGALLRGPMSDMVFRENIREGNEFVKNAGAFTLTAA